RYRVGDDIALQAFRRDELMAFTATLQGERAPDMELRLSAAGNSKPLGKPLVRPSAVD
ncbi:MAG: putative metalloprotease with PDZ domain, partial [Janthinobacterium sp.]